MFANLEEDTYILPGQQLLIPTGFKMKYNSGWMCCLLEKSGLALKGISVGAGIIDPSYRGEVKVLLRNLGEEPKIIGNNHKICQMAFLQSWTGTLASADELDETERGDGGFGSTGE